MPLNTYLKDMESKRLYVIVDSSLPLPYQGVQGGHAVAQWLLDHSGST